MAYYNMLIAHMEWTSGRRIIRWVFYLHDLHYFPAERDLSSDWWLVIETEFCLQYSIVYATGLLTGVWSMLAYTICFKVSDADAFENDEWNERIIIRSSTVSFFSFSTC